MVGLACTHGQVLPVPVVGSCPAHGWVLPVPMVRTCPCLWSSLTHARGWVFLLAVPVGKCRPLCLWFSAELLAGVGAASKGSAGLDDRPNLQITMYNEELICNMQPSTSTHVAQAVARARGAVVPLIGQPKASG